jgi:hypothetical protein
MKTRNMTKEEKTEEDVKTLSKARRRRRERLKRGEMKKETVTSDNKIRGQRENKGRNAE